MDTLILILLYPCLHTIVPIVLYPYLTEFQENQDKKNDEKPKLYDFSSLYYKYKHFSIIQVLHNASTGRSTSTVPYPDAHVLEPSLHA